MKTFFISISIFFLTLTNAFAGQGVLYYKSGIYDIAKGLLQQEYLSENKAEASYYLGNIYFIENKRY